MYSGEVGCIVRIFHISDLHGRSEDGPQGERARREAPLRWRVIRKEWDKNLAARREDGRPVDLVVFTGDLGDWGHKTDYAMGIELRPARRRSRPAASCECPAPSLSGGRRS